MSVVAAVAAADVIAPARPDGTDVEVISWPATPAERYEANRRHTLSHYAFEQREAVVRLYLLAKCHLGTSGGNAAAKFLLGLYNGDRFPFDLTDMRVLDEANFHAAMTVLRMDARRTWCEVHVLLDAIFGPGAKTGAEFEHWAYDMRLPKRCKKEQLPDLPLVDFRSA